MEDTQAKREAMITKITALLNKADDKGCTPEESEAFYAKAQALMTKWAIDEELLKMSGKKTVETIVTHRHNIPSTYFVALIHLWDQVAKANDCFVLQSKGGRGRQPQVILTGYESDIVRVELLVMSLQTFALREAKRESARQGGDYYFRRSFISAFAFRIGDRLREQRKNSVKEAEASAPGVGLALIDKGKAVEQHVYGSMNVARSRGGARKGNWAGQAAGRSAADRADIGNKGVGGSRRALN